eukprot:403350008
MVLKHSILVLSCLCVAFIPEGQTQKVLTYYCGPKTLDIRFCQNDEECKYSDEFCDAEGLCMTDFSLYVDDPCGWNTGNNQGQEGNEGEEQIDPCAAVLCIEGTFCWQGQCFPNRIDCKDASSNGDGGNGGV